MKLNTRHKIGIGIVLVGILAIGASLLVPSMSSYLVIAGIALILVGCFVISPQWSF